MLLCAVSRLTEDLGSKLSAVHLFTFFIIPQSGLKFKTFFLIPRKQVLRSDTQMPDDVHTSIANEKSVLFFNSRIDLNGDKVYNRTEKI